MISFEEFVTAENILNILCKLRAKTADQRHKKLLLENLVVSNKISKREKSLIDSLLPPRKMWISLNESERTKEIIALNGVKYRQPISSFQKNKKSIKRTICLHRKNECKYSYLSKLDDFIDSVKESCLDKNFEIHQPKIYAVSKNKKVNDKVECRPLCIFKDLKDKIIISLVNQYLTILFDPYFYDESLAFRAKREYHGINKYTSHHDSICRVKEFIDRHKKRSIYVAECDMEKFYDTVNHQVVKQSFNSLLSKVQKDYPGIDFSVVKGIFLKYLKCYTFQRDVYRLNKSKEFWENQTEKNGKFGWVESELLKHKYYKNKASLVHSHIGVPQGGAISGLIANIVLNNVDEKIIETIQNDHVLYLRYCDDMLLLTTNLKTCKSLFFQYNASLKQLKLIPHPHKKVEEATNFWCEKSKYPYKWDIMSRPWIGFVGYEINRLGDIRIRKKSIQKEINKQTNILKEINSLLRNKERVTNNSIKESIMNRFIGMSVGRVKLWNYTFMKNELCWINGFKELNYNKYVVKQIKLLDQHRNFIMQKLHKKLPQMGTPTGKTIQSVNVKKIQRFYGKPFSYYYHYMKNLSNTH